MLILVLFVPLKAVKGALNRSIVMKQAPYNPIDVANYIVWRANKLDKPVTHLKLQKLLYYVVAKFAKYNDALLIDENVMKWRYGPVVKSVYHQFKLFGDQEIDAPVNYLSDESNYCGEGKFIVRFANVESINNGLHANNRLNTAVTYVLHTLGGNTAFELVDRTHAEPAWRDCMDMILQNLEPHYSIDELRVANI